MNTTNRTEVPTMNDTAEPKSNIRDPQSGILRVLLVEDNPGDARLIKEMLDETRNGSVHLIHADRLATAIELIATERIDEVLLDLSLPDSHGFETFARAYKKVPDLPIIVLSGFDQEELAVQAVRAGAQDYLVKGEVDGHLLIRALRYAIERKRGDNQLKQAHADLKRSHEELKTSQLQLIQADKLESIGRLAAGIAHEVKNPLEIILMSVEYLSEHLEHKDEQTNMLLDDINYAVRRADSVVRGLLDFSASDEITTGPEDLNSVIEGSLSLVKHQMDRAHVSLVKRFGDNLPPVNIDKNKIQQVFVNLFMNAAHAIDHDGTITIRTHMKQLTEANFTECYTRPKNFEIGETAIIADIEDTGTGIPQDKLAKIFDPFFTTKSTGKGTGLGLLVVSKIIDLHFGMIDITNRTEGGVRARVAFKFQKEQSHDEKKNPARR